MIREEEALETHTPQLTTRNELPSMNKVTAVILAGGRGKRMGALCESRPKPALPFGSNNRVIDFSLKNCVNSGIDNIITLVDYQRSYMSSYLEGWSYTNKPNTNIQILEPKTGSYQGTANAVYQHLDRLTNMGTEEVLILAADHIYQMDYCEMLDFHRQTGVDLTIGVVLVPVERANQFGIVSIDDEGKIVDFQEKPEIPKVNLASMGIYIFNIDVLTKYLLKDALQTDSSHDFGYAVIPEVIKNERAFAYRFNGYWQDIGTPEAYYQAHMDLLGGHLFPNHINGNPIYNELENITGLASIPGNNIRNSIVSENCLVNGWVENSVLSSGVFVSENAFVRDSVVMSGSFIGYGSTVYGCILDEGVEVGEYAHLSRAKSSFVDGERVLVINKGTVIPSYTNAVDNYQNMRYLDSYPHIYSYRGFNRDIDDKDIISAIKSKLQ